jgi:hypothetical protein
MMKLRIEMRGEKVKSTISCFIFWICMWKEPMERMELTFRHSKDFHLFFMVIKPSQIHDYINSKQHNF